MSFLALGLTLIGCISPLLTLAWFWQLKEWRTDRLLEELRREGWITLWGRVRPLLTLLYGGVVLFLPMVSNDVLAVIGAVPFAALSIVQIGLKKQRRPVPTQKALAVLMVATGLLIVAGVGLIVANQSLILPVLPFTVPLWMGIAWALLLPLDAFLKHRVLSAARAARERHPNVTVIGVTGSVGKTTTKELLSCVLRDLEPLTTPVHVNTEMGVAAWMTRVLRNVPTDATTVLIVEMGAYKKGEIALLCSFAQPTMGVVTSVGTQHIALFGSQENLIDAKAELVESLPSSGRAFLNGDNDFARSMKDRVQCPTTIVGTGGRSDLEAFDITETSRGVRFRVNNTNIDVQLPGTHNVTNVLLALAVGEALDIPFPRMAELLRSFTPPSKTFQIREENGVRLLDDTHNGSAASMKAAIAWARNQPETTKVLLTAGLIEMGEYQAPAERDLGTFAAQVFERTVVVNPLSAINFRQGGKNVEILSPQSARVVPGTLLVCSGRMPASVINRLLPKP